ncbi:MAG: substrate-binding domain-containing protein [Clostridiales bacterium]|nr:substrate-binding domain-containing protein [Clostridiales bacterium]
MKISRRRVSVMILAGIVLVLFCATVAGLIYYRKMIRELGEVQEENFQEYPRLYAYIAEDPDSKLTTKIYKEISEFAKNNGCYVELTGQNLSTTFSKTDRFNMAISSKVDGIILEGDDSEETIALIDKATANNIPVVTVLSDCNGSQRKSFVALDNYKLGQEYVKTLSNIPQDEAGQEPLKALVLSDSVKKNYDDVIFSTIQSAANGRNIEPITNEVDISTPFSSQEDVTDKLDNLEEMPDVIICLNDRTSESVYQYILEKNLVGKITVLAYFDSDTIIKAINKGSVYATFAIDAAFVAEKSVTALNEYNDTGFVSDYFGSEYILIDKSNVSSYMPEDKNV